MRQSSSQIAQNPIAFRPLQPDTIKILKMSSISAKVLVFIKKETESPLTDKKQYYPAHLAIVDNHVVQICPRKQLFLSGFQCDYQHQFEVIRKPSTIPGKIGQAQGIRIILKDSQKPTECLIKPETKGALQFFSLMLGHKYIVQLGFHNLFKAHKKIGKGMTASVYNAISYALNKQVAIKSFKRSVYFSSENNNGEISFKKQFKFLTEVSHKNICKFQGVYETQNSTYVVLELLPLSLYGYLQKFGFPNQSRLKSIMSGLLEGISYLHKKGIMHRDLKLQNIMVKKDPQVPGSVIPVIVDLGLAEYYNSEKYLYVRCGTPGYVAPEVLKVKSTDLVQTYTNACDIFSLGIIFHILLFQKPIFEGKQVKDVIRKNCECIINFQNENFSKLTPEGRDLFKRMLQKDPTDRITAQQALNHSYFTGEPLECINKPEIRNTFSTVQSIQTGN